MKRLRNPTAWASTLLALFLFCTAYLYAQEETPPSGTPADSAGLEITTPEVTVQVLTPEQNRINMDIRTSTLSELAAWCRSLGLSEGGTSADLAKRLRDHFKITEQGTQAEDKRKVITIESARSTDYFKIEAVDEDYARLSGDVRITLKDGDAVHQIRARDILFNRSRNILTASGGVEYKKTDGDKEETFRGDSITVDIDNWSSIFLGGVSERTLKSDMSTYLFAGTVISRDEEDVTVLRKARISSANNEESLWSLDATRVWLLPGSDFAVFNAVLKVGEIPVFYIPFFFYPADEMIIHPVIGYRTRAGNYVQTTTYIFGRPKADTSSQSSLTKILGSSNDMEKKREGLFLRSTGKKAVDADALSLRLLVDYYSNLGGFIGTDFVLPKRGILTDNFELNLGIGLTHNLYYDGSSYSPYNDDGSTDWNSSNLFSTKVPFRYRLKTKSSVGGKYGRFTWDVPFYSDPLVDSDFSTRAEEMDWINMLQKGSALEQEDINQNLLGSYVWSFSGQLNPTFPNMSPYINNISISSISLSVSFRQSERMDDEWRYSPHASDMVPSRYYYAPETATLYSVSGSITGTPFSRGASSSSSQTVTKKETIESNDPLFNIGVPRSPFEDKEKEEARQKDQSDKLAPPELTQRFDLPRVGNLRFSVDYRLAPSSASTLRFDYSKWKSYEDVDWGDVSSILTNIGGDGSMTLNMSHSENLFTSSLSYSGNGTWRQYSYLNEEASEYLNSSGETDEAKVNAARLHEYGQSSFSTSYNFNSTLRPLYRNDIFKNSSLSYSLGGLAVRSKFDTAKSTADDPHWDIIWGKWAKEGEKGTKEEGIQFISTHRMSTNLSAVIMDKTQTIAFDAELPPRDPVFSWRTTFNVWITTTEANMRILFPGEPDRRKLDPFNFTERITFGTWGNFVQTLSLDTEDWDHSKSAQQLLSEKMTTLTSRLTLTKWGNFSASFSASRMLGDEYIPKGSDPARPEFEGWTTRPGKSEAGDPNFTLKPKDFSMSYNKIWSMKELWKDRLQFSIGLNTSLFFNLQRYTESRFTFSLDFTAKINNFLDLTLRAESKNDDIYRYFRNWPMFRDADINIPEGRQNNFFLDLVDSFRFDDEELRKRSGYKMSRFTIKADHKLGDWNAALTWSMYPYLPPASGSPERKYEMSNEVSFLIQWVPISEFRSNVNYNKRDNPEWKVEGFGN
jgi:hypothetical protein